MNKPRYEAVRQANMTWCVEEQEHRQVFAGLFFASHNGQHAEDLAAALNLAAAFREREKESDTVECPRCERPVDVGGKPFPSSHYVCPACKRVFGLDEVEPKEANR